MTRRPTKSPLFPYTTLFRSLGCRRDRVGQHTRRGRQRCVGPRALGRPPHHAAANAPADARNALRDLRRSEEHTSELQSHVNLVCRLLLEKKKKIYSYITFSI